jgi:hypothetical protein
VRGNRGRVGQKSLVRTYTKISRNNSRREGNIGVNGTISESFRKYVSNIPGNHEVRELQKTAILGTTYSSESANLRVQ